MKGLISLLAELLPPGFAPDVLHPLVTMAIAVAVAGAALAVVLVCKGVTALYEAGTRRMHVQGRRLSQDRLAVALAGRGQPDHLLQGMTTLNEPSPLDAPDAHLLVGPETLTAIPLPRTRQVPIPRLVSRHTPPRI